MNEYSLAKVQYYLLIIAIAIVMSLLSYHVMLRLFPRFTNILNGNRL